MADRRPGGEPTEPPSERRLRQARQRGDVPRSRDVVSLAVLAAVAAAAAVGGAALLVGSLRGQLARSLSRATTATPSAAAAEALQTVLGVSAPLMAVACGAALAAGLAQVGPLLTAQPLQPQLRRLDPSRNVRNLVGPRAALELLRALAKIAGLSAVAGVTIYQLLPAVLRLAGASPARILPCLGSSLGVLSLRLACCGALLAAADLLLERHRHRTRLKMTKTELKREQREQEGDPTHKAERQRLHRELVTHRMLEAVAEADCVIVNPTHWAVALRYDEATMGAPKVVARGSRLMAARIRQIAQLHGVPVVRNVPLARALARLAVDEEIPAELYRAVAEVLRLVYELDQP